MGCAISVAFASASGASELPETRYVRLDSSGKVCTHCASSTAACIEDRKTGLVWELKTTDNKLRDMRHTYAWQHTRRAASVARCAQPECNASDYVAAVNASRLCGATDWRLPSREELRSIVDYTRAYPGPTIDTDWFSATAANFHWSSNEDASDLRSAWGIGFAFGFDYAYPKESAAHARLVRHARDEITAPTEALADGTLHDKKQRLIWQRCSEGQQWNGATCTGMANRMTFAQTQVESKQRSPWLLPTLPELAGLVDTTRTAATINSDYFPNTQAISYWSVTPLAGRPSMMWLVNFQYGDNFVDSSDERAAVRWVRNE